MFTVILRSQAPKLSKFPEGSYHWGTRCNPRRSKRRGWGFWGRQLAGWGMSSQMWNLAPCSCDERKHWRMLLYFPVPMKDATLLGICWRWNFKTKKPGSHSLKDGRLEKDDFFSHAFWWQRYSITIPKKLGNPWHSELPSPCHPWSIQSKTMLLYLLLHLARGLDPHLEMSEPILQACWYVLRLFT